MKPSASIRNRPEDFLVDEIPMYSPTGTGGHVFVVVKKTGWSTPACIRRIADALKVDGAGIGHAGMKDRHAVTTQTLSIPWPEDGPLPGLSELAEEGIEVLSAERHPHKLRVGHLIGNRFQIVVRDFEPCDRDLIEADFTRVAREGVPNAFGPQRFGKDGDNPDRALAWLRGQQSGPRDRRTQRLLMSSVQSMLFDRLLARRVQNGSWKTVVTGDLVKTVDRGGLFMTEDAEVDARRAEMGGVTATGPIFGPRMRWPEGQPERWEREILDEALGGEEALMGHRKLGAGSRRALRILPSNLQLNFSEEKRQQVLTVRMTLPKGAYATTVLGAVFLIQDASFARMKASKDLLEQGVVIPDAKEH